MRFVKIILSVFIAVLVVVASAVVFASYRFTQAANQTFDIPPIDLSRVMANADITMGERIATVRNGCNDCHGKDFAGTTFISDPMMGTFTAPNLTPTGIAKYSDGDLALILRYGIKPDGKSVVFMPSHETQALSAEDIGSVIRFLRGLPPVSKELTPMDPGIMAKVLFMTGQLPQLFPALLTDKTQSFKSKPAEGETADFGAYLVQSACVGCHGADLSGGPIKGAPPEWPSAADIRWSKRQDITIESFLRMIEDGVSPTSGKQVRYPMPIGALKAMDGKEKTAVYNYLKSL